MKKILIANRGEIAIRIARTCSRLGIKTVAVYSEQDSLSPHLDFCDEVYSLGKGTIPETYLNIEKLIGVLKNSGAQGVHPGYGFLSERAPFAEAVAKAGAKFIGPRPDSMISMGDKIQAKLLMKKMGVPLLPGTDGGVSSLAEAKKAADGIGYPVLLKAAAGGGGKGMRIVHKAEELAPALEAAAREAKTYFGDGTVYIEKYLQNPHHVEVQVLGDGHGGGGHVFDRECSIQRRHQKLVEESPAPLLVKHPKSKQKILDVADSVVKQMKYENAGTLEFLGDDDGGFYFLEMNTRLQVEHPVTEWVTGIDLVAEQIAIAMGKRYGAGGVGATQTGAAIEVRLYAETPFEYLPTGGKVLGLELPQGPFLRIDSGIRPGYEVSLDYDPTLMKLSVWGATRAEAVTRLKAALKELRILGVGSNQALFWSIAHEKDFIAGDYGTPYLEKNRKTLTEFYDRELEALFPKVGAALMQLSSTSQQPKTGTEAIFQTSVWEQTARREGTKGF